MYRHLEFAAYRSQRAVFFGDVQGIGDLAAVDFDVEYAWTKGLMQGIVAEVVYQPGSRLDSVEFGEMEIDRVGSVGHIGTELLDSLAACLIDRIVVRAEDFDAGTEPRRISVR